MARSKQAKPIVRGRPIPLQQRPGGPTLADAGSRIPRLNPTIRRKRRMRPGRSPILFCFLFQKDLLCMNMAQIISVAL
jgi:hypothetical protein